MSRRPHPINAVKPPPGVQTGSPNLPESWCLAEIAQEQLEDPDIGWIIRRKLDSDEPPTPQEVRSMNGVVKILIAQWSQLDVHAGLLTRRWLTPDDNNTRRQLILPVNSRSALIRLAHGGMAEGHLGIRRTFAQVQRRAYWPGWKEDVQLQLRGCVPCSRYLREKPRGQGNLQNRFVGEVAEVIALHFALIRQNVNYLQNMQLSIL